MLSNGSARSLEKPFSKEEVKQAIFSCDGNKAPGPKGFNFNFLKAQWSKIKDELRRNPFDWEIEAWEHFMECLNHIQLDEEMEDKLIWKNMPSGHYTPNSFSELALGNNGSEEVLWREVWARLAPPKVEVFVWQLMKGRIVCKEELVKRNLLHREAAVCNVCNNDVESVNHLFFICRAIWDVWCMWLADWGIISCFPGHAPAFFLAWNNCPVDIARSKDNLDTLKIVRFSLLVAIPTKRYKVKVQVQWKIPPNGWLKFNTDGAARDYPGPLGIGGVLRNEKGMVKMLFSKTGDWDDANLTEMLAIQEALILFMVTGWCHPFGLIIETDSINVVTWVSKPLSSPWRLRNLVLKIKALLSKIPKWQIIHTPRSGNELADSLTKLGVERATDLLQVIP
ncbi:Ribonuclease H domain - like 9 [Theobroma cacao]|nr:Ribonuclease H domain - like 9 [Theobroma cacao]